jgi:hypothetical protein
VLRSGFRLGKLTSNDAVKENHRPGMAHIRFVLRFDLVARFHQRWNDGAKIAGNWGMGVVAGGADCALCVHKLHSVDYLGRPNPEKIGEAINNLTMHYEPNYGQNQRGHREQPQQK